MTRSVTITAVGVDEYDVLRRLSYCVKDAKAFLDITANRYRSVSGTSIDESLLSSASGTEHLPTTQNLQNVLEHISNQDRGPNDVSLFYFSGHGFISGDKDYLATWNTRLEEPSDGICTDDVIAAMRSSGVGTAILIVDACGENLTKGMSHFGERTGEIARRQGCIVFLSCSPGEFSYESSALDGGHGVFTYAFCKALQSGVEGTPVSLDRYLLDQVTQICADQKLPKQTPYTVVAPVQQAIIDIVTGAEPEKLPQTHSKNMIVIIGPTNAGKTTLGQRLSSILGYTHVEMSSFAWDRYNRENNYNKSIQEFMDDVVWKGGKEDQIALDMLAANEKLPNVIVCGPRRVEELERMYESDWNVFPFFIFSNASIRFHRHQHTVAPTRYGLDYRDFVERDLREYAWGLANIPNIFGVDLILNEDHIQESEDQILSKLRSLGLAK